MRAIKTNIQLLGHATFKITTPENMIIIVDPWLINNPYIPTDLENQNVIGFNVSNAWTRTPFRHPH
ncbi:MAG: hypothetical protein ABI850_19910 [Flavobacterium sp.]